MNADIRQRWLAALQSGKYRQGKGLLRSQTDKYCPLGVLCDLHAAHTGREGGWEKGNTPVLDYWSYLGAATEPPPQVLTWAQLDRADAQELMWSNDKSCTSFADAIAYIQEIYTRPSWLPDPAQFRVVWWGETLPTLTLCSKIAGARRVRALAGRRAVAGGQ